MAQGELQGVRFATDCKKIEHTLFDTVLFRVLPGMDDKRTLL